jgi:hypothetical protein
VSATVVITISDYLSAELRPHFKDFPELDSDSKVSLRATLLAVFLQGDGSNLQGKRILFATD